MIEIKTPAHYLVYESYVRSTTNVARFSNRVDAESFKHNHKNKNYLSVSDVPERSLIICESVVEFSALIDIRERAAALAKLTDRERQLLGV